MTSLRHDSEASRSEPRILDSSSTHPVLPHTDFMAFKLTRGITLYE